MSYSKKQSYAYFLEIESHIGYIFSNKDLLKKALTHSSMNRFYEENYERLEFLGDRILGFCIAKLLFDNFNLAKEGELSVRFNHLVSAETCSQVAEELQLHLFIRVGSDLKKVSGKPIVNIQADVIESLIAAIYLDGGLEAASSFIIKNWKKRALKTDAARRDAKTELQEWAHAKFGVTPKYKVDSRSGPDHDPRFTVTVEIPGIDPGVGINCSKRAAEQIAAADILKREFIWEENKNERS
ncbi:Ribonuclease III [Liberibacter crescens BT-1]|uniref:Ribonuclease 3 n=1 Tax=Liberibacter crescens (strain BT-1) TaxID=1215343 RepID=L0EUP2_LIBCB|nr:ribonuclease III [Liberibacter crescens]AGA64682.1 Ribonuclease III [Liberibacter crescens BT-1]AMC12781.1 ribonuclease III [Liberibacter crescens]